MHRAARVRAPGAGAQETPDKTLSSLPGLAVASIVHRVPFHRSARVTVMSAGERVVPTPRQLLGPPHQTASRTESAECVFAADSTRHLVPFHASASVVLRPVPRKSPTATHDLGAPQEMARNSLLSGPGTGRTAQSDPSQDIASARAGPAAVA